MESKSWISAMINKYKDKFVVKVLDEELYTVFFSLYFEPYHFLYKPFNDLIPMLIQSGLIDYWIRETRLRVVKWKPEEPEPVVLTWNHVYVGFYICMICIAVATACFIAEVVTFKLKLLMIHKNEHKILPK